MARTTKPRQPAAKDRNVASKTRSKPAKKPRRTAISEKVQGPSQPGTKQATLIALLRRPKGVTIAEMAKATSWQPHSVRGALSGTLKKKLGLAVTSEPTEDRGRVYRIAAEG